MVVDDIQVEACIDLVPSEARLKSGSIEINGGSGSGGGWSIKGSN